MLPAVEIVVAEEVDVSMAEVMAEEVEEEVYEVKLDTGEEVVEEAAAHMKMELIYHISPITLKIQSGPYSQTIQGKGSLRNWYAKIYWPIKVGEPPALSLFKRIMKIS